MTFKKIVKKPATKTTASSKAPVRKTASAVRPKPVKIVYKASADLKSHFIEVGFRLGRDSLLSPANLVVESIKGKPDNENAPRYDLIALDPATAMALVTRLNYRLFAPNALKRLPAGAEYLVRIRVSVTGEGLVRSRVTNAWKMNTTKGKLVEIIDKKNVEYRKIRMASRFLGGAFARAKGFIELKEEDTKIQAYYSSQEEADVEEAPVKRTKKVVAAAKKPAVKKVVKKTTRR